MQIHTAYLVACDMTDISASDLQAELIQLAADGCEATTYRLRGLTDDEREISEQGNMVYVPTAGRAGIAWGADAAWTDCSSAEDALARWLAGTMCN